MTLIGVLNNKSKSALPNIIGRALLQCMEVRYNEVRHYFHSSVLFHPFRIGLILWYQRDIPYLPVHQKYLYRSHCFQEKYISLQLEILIIDQKHVLPSS